MGDGWYHTCCFWKSLNNAWLLLFVVKTATQLIFWVLVSTFSLQLGFSLFNAWQVVVAVNGCQIWNYHILIIMSSVISLHAVELYDCKHGEILQKISSSLLKYCPSLTGSLLFPFSYVLSPGLFFSTLWGRWSGRSSTRGLGQIWLEVREKSRFFFQILLYTGNIQEPMV